MPKFTNRSARLLHFNNGMCSPGQDVELEDAEVQKPAVQALVDAGDLVPEREAKKAQQAEEKAQEQAQAKAAEQPAPKRP